MTSRQMELAEKLTLRRARGSLALGVLFLTSMATSLNADFGESRPGKLHLAAWVVWAAALLMLVGAGGGLLRGKAVRGLMNDDTTVENRRTAMISGFWAVVLCAFLLYGLSFFEQISGRMAIRLLLSIAVGVAAIRFGILERRALKGG